MALESGGRADKMGNTYENRFLAKQLLRLVEGKIKSIEVEPLGEEGKGVEFVATKNDGGRIYYQCKSSNKSKDSWTISDLENHHVFNIAKQHILRGQNNEYHFISPGSYKGLSDLCKRARTNHSIDDFLENQLTNTLRSTFYECALQFEGNTKNSSEATMSLLSKCYFETVPLSEIEKQDFETMLSHVFTGSSETCRILLENYVNDTEKYGKELSPYDVVSFLHANGYDLRNYGKDENIISRIQALNSTYWQMFTPINGHLFDRGAATVAIKHLSGGDSVILHGKAGSGKSGCLEIVSNYLQDNNIPFLRVKLDHFMPDISSTQFGNKLGLPDSPIRCIERVSSGGKCVLILDQLDSLRWTTIHSPTAIAVCKDMIREAESANKNYGAQISILLAVRTFDLKNDVHIRDLLNSGKAGVLHWKEIEVGLLSDDAVRNIVGNEYNALSNRIKEILKNPASLYVWSQLDSKYHSQNITSANQLVNKWWEQILSKNSQKSLSTTDMSSFAIELAKSMSYNGLFAVPRMLYVAKTNYINALISEGMLVESQTLLSFTHQTFLDYFIVQDDVSRLLNGEKILDILGNYDEQTPNLRYRFMVLLQELCDFNEDFFVKQCKLLLSSANVRYYYKCTIFDAIGQATTPGDILCQFAYECWNSTTWHEYIRQVAYYGNPIYIRHLLESGSISCLSDEGISFLKSINSLVPDFIVDTLTPYYCTTPEINQKIFDCLCYDVDDDSDRMYQLRLNLIQSDPSLLAKHPFLYYRAFFSNPCRAIDYTLLLLKYKDSVTVASIHSPNEKELVEFSINNYLSIIDRVMPALFQATAHMSETAHQNCFNNAYLRWHATEYNESILRKIVSLVKTAICELAKQSPDLFLKELLSDEYSKSLVGNELILTGMLHLPVKYADNVIDWLVCSFPTHIFSYTGSQDDYLALTKSLLTKFTPYCSEELFSFLLQHIMSWSDPTSTMVDRLKRRVEHQKHWPVYHAYWGFMQKELLPTMDSARLHTTEKELIGVLNRNEWIHIPHYCFPFHSGQAKNVVSPVSSYADKLGDKTWLKIIQTPSEKMHSHPWKETANAFYEATHTQFSVSMGVAAEKDPIRFANLALSFPNDCYSGYVAQVIRAQRKNKDDDVYADTVLTSSIILRFACRDDAWLQKDILSVIKSRPDENWPDMILNYVEKIALLPIEKTNSIASTQQEEIDGNELYTSMLNSAQGVAVQTMATLVFAQAKYASYFQKTISTLASSTDSFLRLALVDCAAAYYKKDPSYAASLFKEQITKDYRVLISNYAWPLICKDYDNAPNFYVNQLVSALRSSYSDIAEKAATLLCAVAIYRFDCDAQQAIFESSFSKKQAHLIVHQAACAFNQDNHRELCKQIIVYMAQNHPLELYSIGSDFWRENIVIERDRDFLLQFIDANAEITVLLSLVKFFCETEESIIAFADVIYKAVKQIAERSTTAPMRITVQDLVQCVSHLYDVGKDDPHVKCICLDIWDELFKNNLHDIQSLTSLLDYFN